MKNQLVIHMYFYAKIRIMPQSLEDQKQELLDNALLNFGNEYFEKLEKYSQDLIILSNDNQYEYTISINNQGAFYAS